MSSNSNLPAVLGGDPIREPGTYRTTPEVTSEDMRYVAAQILEAQWNPGPGQGGLPLEDGLVVDSLIAESLGTEHARFAAEFLNVHAPEVDAHAVPNSNGTHAIGVFFNAWAHVARQAGRRVPGYGDEVIFPGLTWKGSITALRGCNLVPRPVDVLPGTVTIDPAAVEAAITDRTAAIIGVDICNRMFDRDPIVALARKHDLILLEDCAQSVGAVYKGRPAGAIGHGGTFSLQGSKVLSAVEGGVIVTARGSMADPLQDELFEWLVSATTCGRPVARARGIIADNDRMVLPSLGRAQLVRFPEQNAKRVRTFAALDEVARGLPGVEPLDAQPDVDLPPTYKWLVRIVGLDEFWGGMTLDQVKVALMAAMGAHVDRTYAYMGGDPAPVAHYPNAWDPTFDPFLPDDLRERADRRNYPTPVAEQLFNSVLGVEAALGLDDRAPQVFADVVRNTQAHGPRLAREVVAS